MEGPSDPRIGEEAQAMLQIRKDKKTSQRGVLVEMSAALSRDWT